ncbi:MAG TPA: trypsin-like peptidase domain-containing protein [Acidimicrobiales bacterium]|nr:trypsin-like peptidase domain-containing protein [Acidimicrobiales bacterium]
MTERAGEQAPSSDRPTSEIPLPWTAGPSWVLPPEQPAPPPPPPPSGGGGWEPPWWNPPGPWWNPPPLPPRRRRWLAPVVAALAAATMLAGVGLGYAVWRPSGSSLGSGASSFGLGPQLPGPFGSAGPSSGADNAAGGPADAAAIAAKVDPALVDINTTLGYQGGEAAGTGIVLSPGGLVLTNNHVIDGATSISATDVGNGRTYNASVVGYDRSEDVALLQLHGASGLATASLGDSSTAAVGQAIVAIGNAGGSGGTPSAAGGSITNLNQSITASSEGSSDYEQLNGLMEINADVQPGDSGGPVVNTAGKVIGVTTAASSRFSFQYSGNDAFAIPIDTAMGIARQIEAGQASSSVHVGPTALLGVEVQDASSASGLGPFGAGAGALPDQGALVAGVAPASPAASAGLSQGDVITGFGGRPVSSARALTDLLVPYHPGDRVRVAWVDPSGSQHSATVTLATGPAA